ncbi:MAG: trypsin-like peptidase domain-containing protein, partial [Planctomycetes bacterium]|nr:trypsin-like peptidase domain-containing protein [Planctomycetota bacterium]
TIMMAIERTVGRERKRMAIIGSGAMGLVIVAAFFALRSADDRNTKLERQQRIIANEQSKLASEGGNFEELNTILRESIYMVRVQYLDDGVWKDTGQTGTAWQVDHRLATNAHVAEMFPEASQRNQRMVARVARRGEVVELLITGVKNHPGYDAFARLTAQTSPYQGNLRFLGLLPAWDVALMEVADEDQSKMIRPLPQAAASDVLALESGAGVFFLGFPTEGATNGGTDPRRPVATFRTGSISKVQDYFMGPGKPEDMRLLTFDFSANGGGSGSPIFNRKGEVIALLNSIDVASKGAAGRISGDNSYGMRVDVLIELMDGRAESLLPSRMREWADTLEPQWREGLDRFREEAHAVAASKFKDLASLDFRCRIKDRKVAKIRGTGYQNAATFTWRARELGTGIFMAVAFCRDRPEFMGLRQTILNQGLEDRVESSLGTWWAATWVSAQNPTPLKYEVFAADGAYSGQTEVELVLYEIVPN